MITFSEFKENFRRTRPVYSLSVKAKTVNKTTLFLLLGMLLPYLVQLIIYFYGIYDNRWGFLQIERRDLTGGNFYKRMMKVQFNAAFPYFYTMAALILGTNMYRDEINEDTISYIMTKPLPRDYIFIQKYLAYLRMALAVTMPALTVSFWTAVLASFIFDAEFDYAGKGDTLMSYLLISTYNWLIFVVGLFILVSTLGIVFVTTGMLLRRPLLANLFIGFGILIEQILIDLIDNRIEPLYLSINFIVRMLIGYDDAFPGFLVKREIYNFNEVATLINTILILIIGILFGMKRAKQKEFW